MSLCIPWHTEVQLWFKLCIKVLWMSWEKAASVITSPDNDVVITQINAGCYATSPDTVHTRVRRANDRLKSGLLFCCLMVIAVIMLPVKLTERRGAGLDNYIRCWKKHKGLSQHTEIQKPKRQYSIYIYLAAGKIVMLKCSNLPAGKLFKTINRHTHIEPYPVWVTHAQGTQIYV